MPGQPSDWTFLAMAAPFVAAALAPAAKRAFGGAAGWVLAIVPAAIFLHFLRLVPAVAAGEVLSGAVRWSERYGIDLSFRIDGLSLLFALLISGIGTFIVIYSGPYLKGHPQQGRFFGFMLLFMGSMLGLVLADDFLALFVFWEMTSISSFLLIGFDHNRMAARRAAYQALVVTSGGGLALLAGLLLVMATTGMGSLSEVLAAGGALRASPYYPAILVLVLGGAFTKSAQFPFHFWLPNAMEAPTPVSAYLHSATMVKAGVYLLMRLNPVLGDTVAWMTVLPIFGGVTLVAGALLAVRQTDLKMLLAYTTMASLGLLVMLTGAGAEGAILGAATYLLAHSLFKGGLFMVVGGIDHEAGTRQVAALGGLAREMPITLAAALGAAASMGGLPLTIGFFGKETMYEALAHGSGLAFAALFAAVIGNALMFAAGFAVAILPFFGRRRAPNPHVHQGPAGLWLGPAVLALCGIAAILFGAWTGRSLLLPATLAIAGAASGATVSAAIHLNLAFALSLATMALGILVLWRLAAIRGAVARVLAAIGWGPDRGFDQAIAGLSRFAALVTRTIQTGNLEMYIFVTMAMTAIALLVPMGLFDEWPSWPAFAMPSIAETAMILLAVGGVAVVLGTKQRLTAIVSLGAQGFAVAMLFMLYGAPDLSFTQFMVETLSVVILTLAMTRLSLSPSDHRSVPEFVKDGIVAIGCGVGFGFLLLAATEAPFDSRLSDFFAQNSRAIAHGHNIVNVIIVDFRGLDTLGEISVVMVAGLAILALLRVRTRGKADEAGEGA
ncbi:putative monovalent cation/H+ antiporter subunit A [Propylenella binzhouense]|uniref:Monovalent cation/H+ antiporter subunit A n=1 Tax=Propylenella binzhouense TaxID=2555902 RepID=A0A964WTU9_9HYPH|nr:putative monovalent cation/H+ antiporter subunit A [Propylenella binzhouense]MYZ48379.1 putative monovalent cation/H+ antiporter subunit A [Propylenella binzhouense]